MADQSGQIQTNALSPAEAASDGDSARQHAIPDQIAGDRYANARLGAKKINRGLRFSKILAAGPASDQQGTMSGGDSSFDSGNTIQ